MEKGLLYNEEDVDYLRSKWLALSGEHLGPKYWTLFDAYYREPQRHYHNFFHLRMLYEFYDQWAAPLLEADQTMQQEGKKVFLYSLWFHDVIYEPQRKDNEEKSAQLFQMYAAEDTSIDTSSKELITDIIHATISHQLPEKLLSNPFSHQVASLFLDADLSVLGWDPVPDYENYAWGIWKEYEFFGRENYCEGRPAVLERMLTQREHLYFHPKIRQEFEARARENVKNEIKALKGELMTIGGVAGAALGVAKAIAK